MKGIPDIVPADTTGEQELGRTPAVERPRHTMGPTNRTPNDWLRAKQELVRHYA